MTEYNFERFSALVVEDNFYLSSLLVQSLKALSIGNIRVAGDAGEAIDILQMMKHDPTKAGLMSVDLVFSNWQMEPVDGFMLLRWVRRHKDSPNRFIPFVMVTAYADRDRVGQARDMGVTEILAKPFSVNSIAMKLMQAIERPRQFVHTPNYFGPDRRRKSHPVSNDKERRYMREADVEIIND
jgi:two-component system chemotaxis response regulator CheY